MVLGAGEAFTNNGTLTAGKGNSVFSAQRLFLNAPGSLQAGGDVSLNSRSDITISGFTGTAGSLTMNVAGTLLNSALIYAGNNLKLFTDRLHNQHGDIRPATVCGYRRMLPAVQTQRLSIPPGILRRIRAILL